MAFQNKSLQRRIYIVSSIEVAAFNNESVWAVLFIDWYEQLEDVKKLQVKGHAEQCHWFWNQGYPKSKKKLRCQIVVLLFVCFFVVVVLIQCDIAVPILHAVITKMKTMYLNKRILLIKQTLVKSPVDGLLSTYHSRGFERGGYGQH